MKVIVLEMKATRSECILAIEESLSAVLDESLDEQEIKLEVLSPLFPHQIRLCVCVHSISVVPSQGVL